MTRDQAIKALSAWKPNPDDVPPQLIADFTAYNTSFNDMSDAGFESVIERGYGRNWVGDLALGFELDARSTSGKVSVELIKGGRPFRCRIDLANGDAEFSIGGDGAEAVGYHRTGKTTVVGTGHHDIVFANVDDELTLWVDGKVATFTNPAAGGKLASSAEQHPNGYNSTLLNDHVPTVADLSPAGIAADGAAVKVSHIKVMRDIYYIAEFYSGRPSQPTLTDFKAYKPDLADPKTWPMAFARNNMRSETIVIAGPNSKRPGKDRFFVLGDNSGKAATAGFGRASGGSIVTCSSARPFSSIGHTAGQFPTCPCLSTPCRIFRGCAWCDNRRSGSHAGSPRIGEVLRRGAWSTVLISASIRARSWACWAPTAPARPPVSA